MRIWGDVEEFAKQHGLEIRLSEGRAYKYINLPKFDPLSPLNLDLPGQLGEDYDEYDYLCNDGSSWWCTWVGQIFGGFRKDGVYELRSDGFNLADLLATTQYTSTGVKFQKVEIYSDDPQALREIYKAFRTGRLQPAVNYEDVTAEPEKAEDSS